MRKLVVFLILLAVFCTAAFQALAQGHPSAQTNAGGNVIALQATPEATAEATAVAGAPAARPDLLTLLQTDPDARFTTLLAALKAANMQDLLAAGNPFTITVLAPTNDAFTATLTELGMTQDQLLANTSLLKEILSYHLLPGKYFFRDLTSGPTIATDLLGQSVTFNLTKGVFTVNGANISDPDNLASNGMMIAIDSVLLPPDVQAMIATPEPTVEATAAVDATATPEPTPEATAVAGAPAARPDLLTLLQTDPDGRFTTLLAALQAANMQDLLAAGNPFTITVLAPTNDAFTATLTELGMTQDQLLANTSLLKEILSYHLLPGKYFFRDLTSGPTIATDLLGQSVTFNLTKGAFTVNGANISDPDNLASNGMMIAIDSVLLPPDVQAMIATPEPTVEATAAVDATATPDPTMEATAEATAVVGAPAARPDLLTLLQTDPDGRFTTLLAALQAANMQDLLAAGNPFTITVLAPTNDAFTATLTELGMTQDQLLANPSLLKEILSYHLLPGKYFFRDLTSGPTIATDLLGQSVTFNLTKGAFTVNGANISDPDNLAANGMMIAINSVLLPPDVQAMIATPEPTVEATAVIEATATPEPTVEATPEATAVAGVPAARPDLMTLLQNDPDGRFTTLIAAFQAANDAASKLLSDPGNPFTITASAPTNDAFTATAHPVRHDSGSTAGESQPCSRRSCCYHHPARPVFLPRPDQRPHHPHRPARPVRHLQSDQRRVHRQRREHQRPRQSGCQRHDDRHQLGAAAARCAGHDRHARTNGRGDGSGH